MIYGTKEHPLLDESVVNAVIESDFYAFHKLMEDRLEDVPGLKFCTSKDVLIWFSGLRTLSSESGARVNAKIELNDGGYIFIEIRYFRPTVFFKYKGQRKTRMSPQYCGRENEYGVIFWVTHYEKSVDGTGWREKDTLSKSVQNQFSGIKQQADLADLVAENVMQTLQDETCKELLFGASMAL